MCALFYHGLSVRSLRVLPMAWYSLRALPMVLVRSFRVLRLVLVLVGLRKVLVRSLWVLVRSLFYPWAQRSLCGSSPWS